MAGHLTEVYWNAGEKAAREIVNGAVARHPDLHCYRDEARPSADANPLGDGAEA
jgi:hypothetical protein